MGRHGEHRRDDALTDFQAAMNNVLRDVFTPTHDARAWLGPQKAGYVPLIDLSEGEDLLLTIELPGLGEEDFRISIHEGTLVIEGNKRLVSGADARRFHHTERVYGFFRRTIPLPKDVDHTRVTATLRNGVLSVVMPKHTHSGSE